MRSGGTSSAFELPMIEAKLCKEETELRSIRVQPLRPQMPTPRGHPPNATNARNQQRFQEIGAERWIPSRMWPAGSGLDLARRAVPNLRDRQGIAPGDL